MKEKSPLYRISWNLASLCLSSNCGWGRVRLSFDFLPLCVHIMCWPRRSEEWVGSVNCDRNVEVVGVARLKSSWSEGLAESENQKEVFGVGGGRGGPAAPPFCLLSRPAVIWRLWEIHTRICAGEGQGARWVLQREDCAVWLEQPENLQTRGPSWLWVPMPGVCGLICSLVSILGIKRKWNLSPLKWISIIWVYWAVCPFQTKPANPCPCPHLPVESWLVTPRCLTGVDSMIWPLFRGRESCWGPV